MSTIKFKEFINYLNELYKPKDGYISYSKELLATADQQQIALTYGEILPESLNIIINKLDLNKNDIFYDLGAGVGKVALQFCLTTPVQQSYGIEALEIRHKIAQQAYLDIQNKLPNFFINKTLASIYENFLAYKLNNPTIIFMDSLCYSDEMIRQLINIFNAIPTIKHIISVTPLKLKHLKLQDKSSLQFSWSTGNSTKVYIYH